MAFDPNNAVPVAQPEIASGFNPDNAVQVTPTQAQMMTHSGSSSQTSMLNPAVMGGGTLQLGPLDTGIPIGQGGMRRLATIGSKFADLGQGVSQLFGGATPEDVQAKRELDKPLLDTPEAPLAGAIGTAAMAAPLSMLPGGQSVLGAGIYGAAFGGLQPHATDAEWIRNAGYSGVGSGVGQGLGKALGAFAGPEANVSPLTQGQQQAKAIGKALGFQLTPGKASGNVAQQQIDAWLESHPSTSGPFNAIRENNQKALNAAWADRIGMRGQTELSSPVLNDAHDKIDAVYEAAKAIKAAPINPDSAVNTVAQAELDHMGQFKNPDTVFADHPLVKQYLKFAANGDATGGQLVALRSNLGKAARSQMTASDGDRALGGALYDVQNAVDQHLSDAAGPELSPQLDTARGQYRDLMNLESRSGVINPSSGNINPRTLATVLQQRDKSGYLRGNDTSDAYNATRFSQAFPDVVGNSGTATRETPDMTIAGIAAHAGGAIGSRVYMSPVGQALTKATTIPAVMLARGLAKLPPGAIPSAGAAIGLANSPK